MKICHVGNPGSIAVSVFVDHFTEQGHEVHTFGWGPYPFKKRTNLIHHNLSVRNSRKIISDNVQMIKSSSDNRPGRRSLHFRAIFDLYEFILMKCLIHRIKPDLIHGHEASGYGYTTGSFKRLPTIITCWGSDINKFPWESRWVHFKVNYALHHADLIHVTDENFARTITERFGIPPKKVRIINWGVDTRLFSYENIDKKRLSVFKNEIGIADGEFVILYPAGFRDCNLQNYISLAEAFVAISKRFKNTKLVMLSYTRRSGYDQLKKILDDNNLWGRVKIIDQYLPQADMPYLFASAQIMTLLHDVDQMSASISESMLMRCNLLLSDIKPYRDAYKEGENVIFSNQKDPSDIEAKLAYMIENHDNLRERFGERNIALVKKRNSREVQIKKIEDMYSKVINNKPRS